MIGVLGGVYWENCLSPDWNKLFGSGLRAATAIADLANEIHLFTCASESEQARLESYAGQLIQSIQVKIHRSVSIEFQYDHSASAPRLFPDYRDLTLLQPFELQTTLDNALLFSFIECQGFPRVEANYLVYDPQAGHRAVPFAETGCSAEHLAIVLNLSEAKAIASRLGVSIPSNGNPSTLARRILSAEQAEVVVIKNGIFGACVKTKDGELMIPSYKAERFFGIGTGDVFSGVFACLWAEMREDPFEAARLASVASAFYAGHGGTTPIPPNLEDLAKALKPARLDRLTRQGLLKTRFHGPIYLAGPFFDLSQTWLLNVAYEGLAGLGIDVWSPAAEAGILDEHAIAEEINEVVMKDLEAIDHCNAVLAVVNGMDPGTLVEIGYAVAKGKSVTVFVERSAPSDLTMLQGSGCGIYDDLASAIYNCAWQACQL